MGLILPCLWKRDNKKKARAVPRRGPVVRHFVVRHWRRAARRWRWRSGILTSCVDILFVLSLFLIVGRYILWTSPTICWRTWNSPTFCRHAITPFRMISCPNYLYLGSHTFDPRENMTETVSTCFYWAFDCFSPRLSSPLSFRVGRGVHPHPGKGGSYPNLGAG